jgi:signal peptide peptidase SppA
VAYEDQVDEKLRAGEKRRQLDTDDYGRVSLSSLGLNKGPRIAIIYATGTINSGKSGYDPVNGAIAGSDTLIEYIRQARRDTSVRAIVLRVDSPGGSATASDAIWRELVLTKNENSNRPLVVSMSDLAASGGYYIAMPGQVIVAQPSTLTGSIGIFGGKFVTGGVYEKLGAHIESTSVGKNAEINSPARPYNPDELKKLQEQLQSFYDQFDCGRQRRGAGRLSAAKELLRVVVGAAQRVERILPVGRVRRMAEREPVEGGDRSAAHHARSVRDVPPWRAPGADAVHLLTLRTAGRASAGCSLKRFSIYVDLHLQLRLRHVGRKEAVAAIGQQFFAETVLR